ncbi:MAG: iron-containing alcohol dehydrogenase [Gammaproteobacteria bacterium]|nr:iron-containing alcohol dehydrogenase [Gammaproteobacteria bacterium]MDH5731922.1 iron-containing alcohol dehydrogenase [Gammaproteobacteria bacterium]
MQFSIARLPRVESGRGSLSKLCEIIKQYGQNVLLVTGGQYFQKSPHWERLNQQFIDQKIRYLHFPVASEPSPLLIDAAVEQFRNKSIDCVVAIGGGSALDAAKAISGLLKLENSVMDYLEGVGPELDYQGPALPLIAVPTTAGTGSEATKNAVLSMQSVDGFKKSFRHDKLVAEYTILDADLIASCPKDLIAANGMDALTQLIESYVSIKANPFTDSLAFHAIELVRNSLLQWYQTGSKAKEAQENMLYAAFISGVTLAQVGLGSVHGLASPLGAFFPIPHGVACGSLLADATEINIQAMQQRESNNPALEKYANLGRLFSQSFSSNIEQALDNLIGSLKEYTTAMEIPLLSVYGVRGSDISRIVANSRGSSMKTNPIVLRDDEIAALIQKRL